MSHNFRISVADSNSKLIFSSLHNYFAFFSTNGIKVFIFRKIVATLISDQSNWVAWKQRRKDYTWTKPFPKPVRVIQKMCLLNLLRKQKCSTAWKRIERDLIFRVWTVQLYRYFSQWNHFDYRYKWDIKYLLHFSRGRVRLGFKSN